MIYMITGGDSPIDRHITSVLLRFGVSICSRGFLYLHQSVKIAYLEPEEAVWVTKTLYPRVAKAFSTKISAVQSGCRNGIRHAYDSHGLDGYEDYFDEKHQPLKSSAFIQLTAEKLRHGEL